MSTKITIQVTISASQKKTWDYYTMPDHITKWNFADPSWHCPSASNDLQLGGQYEARMEAKDGSFGFDFKAIYKSIVSGKSFTYELEDGRQATVTFDGNEHQTDVTIVFDPEEENSIEMQKNGWQAILNNFKTYTESN